MAGRLDPQLAAITQRDLLRSFYEKCTWKFPNVSSATIKLAQAQLHGSVIDRWHALGMKDSKFFREEFRLVGLILSANGVYNVPSSVASTSVLGKRPQDVVDLCSDGEGQGSRQGLGKRTNGGTVSRPRARVGEDLTSDDDIASSIQAHLNVARQQFKNCPTNPLSARSKDTAIDNRTSEALTTPHAQVHINKPSTTYGHRSLGSVQNEDANLQTVAQILEAGAVLTCMPNLPRGAFRRDLTNLVSDGQLRRGATAAFSPYDKSPNDFVARDGVMGKVIKNLRKNGVDVVAARVQTYDERLSSDSNVDQMPKVVLGFHGDGKSSADNRITFEATKRESSREVGFGMSSGGRPIPLKGGKRGKIVGKLVKKTHTQGTMSIMNWNAAGVNTQVMHAAAEVEDEVHLGVLDVRAHGKPQQELADIVNSTDLSDLSNDTFFSVDLPNLPLSEEYETQLAWNKSEEGRLFASKGGSTTNINGTSITITKEAYANPQLLTEPIHQLARESLKRKKSRAASKPHPHSARTGSLEMITSRVQMATPAGSLQYRQHAAARTRADAPEGVTVTERDISKQRVDMEPKPGITAGGMLIIRKAGRTGAWKWEKSKAPGKGYYNVERVPGTNKWRITTKR